MSRLDGSILLAFHIHRTPSDRSPEAGPYMHQWMKYHRPPIALPRALTVYMD